MKTSKFISIISLSFLVVLSFICSANATITSTSGSIVEISPPTSVEQDALEHNTEIRAFNERIITLSSDLELDTGEIIGAGTTVQSHLLHFDTSSGAVTRSDGDILFASSVLGLIYLTDSLADSDSIFGLTTVAYSGASLGRGFEEPLGTTGTKDNYTISDHLVSFDLVNLDLGVRPSWMDEVRVVTTVVPEPISSTLFIVGAATLGFRRFRKKITN